MAIVLENNNSTDWEQEQLYQTGLSREILIIKETWNAGEIKDGYSDGTWSPWDFLTYQN